jgi:exopolyphosphatase/guanosine-5'-triphosphate,3'-diphosphate pyrophosphatase
MRAATVDVGTNSVLLLCAELEAAGARILEERCRITRLGQGVDRPGQSLDPRAVARTMDALREYAEVMAARRVDRRAAVGTAVLRLAGGSDDFVSEAERLLGCPLEVISGEREASLTRAGVRGACGAPAPGTLLFDVGGGSTELVLEGGGEAASVSLELGAVRLSEGHLHGDPPGAGELAAARVEVRETLCSLPAAFQQPVHELIGLAGTVTTMATVALALEPYDTEKVNGLRLDRSAIDDQIRRFAGLPLAERRRIVGLPPARADVILGGALIVEGILDRFAASGFRVCDRGVRWGRFWELVAAPG